MTRSLLGLGLAHKRRLALVGKVGLGAVKASEGVLRTILCCRMDDAGQKEGCCGTIGFECSSAQAAGIGQRLNQGRLGYRISQDSFW